MSNIDESKVNHPKHYQLPGRKECLEEMLDIFGLDKVMAFCELNAYKYRYRHALKNGDEDLAKATWYENKLQTLKLKQKSRGVIRICLRLKKWLTTKSDLD